MNVGIIFDSKEYSPITANTELADKSLYEHSFETMYRHPLVDAVYMFFKDAKAAKGYRWLKADIDKETGCCKNTEILWGDVALTDVFHYAVNLENDTIDCFVIQDIRYPLIPNRQIEKVIASAYKDSIAVTSAGIEDWLMTADGKRALDVETYRFIKSPIAIKTGCDIPEAINEDMYRAIAACSNTCLCEADDTLEALIDNDDLLYYEAVIKARKGNDNGLPKEKDAS